MALGTRRKHPAPAPLGADLPAVDPTVTTAVAAAVAPTAPVAAPVAATAAVSAGTPPAVPADLMPPTAEIAPDDVAVEDDLASPDEVAELRTAVTDLQSMVASLVARTDQPAATDDSDAASRIIVAANHAAELTLDAARAEADEVLATAKAKSFEIIEVARDLAEQELAAERERVASGAAAWDVTRSEVTDRLRSLEVSLAAYRSDLDAAVAAVAAAVLSLSTVEVAPAEVAVEAAPEGEPAVALPTPGDGSKRSNLFGGDASTRRAETDGSTPVNGAAEPVNGATNGSTHDAVNGSANGAVNGTAAESTNGAANPAANGLRAGFFGR